MRSIHRWLAILLVCTALLPPAIAADVPSPAHSRPLRSAPMLSGRVYEGNMHDDRYPLSDITVTLYASNNQGNLGVVVAHRIGSNGRNRLPS